MPPGIVKTDRDEELWEKAKAMAAEQGHAEDWPYIVGIFKQMKGGKLSKAARQPDIDALRKQASELLAKLEGQHRRAEAVQEGLVDAADKMHAAITKRLKNAPEGQRARLLHQRRQLGMIG